MLLMLSALTNSFSRYYQNDDGAQLFIQLFATDILTHRKKQRRYRKRFRYFLVIIIGDARKCFSLQRLSNTPLSFLPFYRIGKRDLGIDKVDKPWRASIRFGAIECGVKGKKVIKVNSFPYFRKVAEEKIFLLLCFLSLQHFYFPFSLKPFIWYVLLFLLVMSFMHNDYRIYWIHYGKNAFLNPIQTLIILPSC